MLIDDNITILESRRYELLKQIADNADEIKRIDLLLADLQKT
jgi:hypothetical protein